MSKQHNRVDLTLAIYQMIRRHGKSNPVMSTAIEQTFGVTGSTIRSVVRSLRRSGEPIVSFDKGYYFDNSHEGVRRISSNLRGRALSMLRTASDLEKKYGIEQETVFEGVPC